MPESFWREMLSNTQGGRGRREAGTTREVGFMIRQHRVWTTKSATALLVSAIALCASCSGFKSSGSTPRPIAESWSPAPPMVHSRSAHAVVATDAGIYVIGGTGAGGAPVMQVERFDGNDWRDETTLPGEGLNAPAAVAIGSRIYVIGGFKTT